MASERDNRESFFLQARYCDANDAPITAALCRALGDAVDHGTRTGLTVLGWPGHPIADALPLRLVGGVHALWRRGAAPLLDPLFARDDMADGVTAARETLAIHDAELLGWLDGPPQTNEPGRAAGLMAGLLALCARWPGQRVELIEIGSSAGLNLLIDRFAFDLGGVRLGPDGSMVRIAPEWRGPPPPSARLAFASIRGVDLHPIDTGDPVQAERLLAYIWPDHRARFARVQAAIALRAAHPVRLDRDDAADWLAARLAEPQADGVLRVLMHSIVWQYLGAERQARITRLMEDAGAAAGAARPLGWIALEADRTLARHDLTVRTWPGDGTPRLLAHAHAHGFWLDWLGVDLGAN